MRGCGGGGRTANANAVSSEDTATQPSGSKTLHHISPTLCSIPRTLCSTPSTRCSAPKTLCGPLWTLCGTPSTPCRPPAPFHWAQMTRVPSGQGHRHTAVHQGPGTLCRLRPGDVATETTNVEGVKDIVVFLGGEGYLRHDAAGTHEGENGKEGIPGGKGVPTRLHVGWAGGRAGDRAAIQLGQGLSG